MNRVKKVIVVFFLFLLPKNFLAQHYSLFSQYLVNGLVINPAYAGRNEVLDITVLSRKQWGGLAGAPVNSSFSVNTPLRNPTANVGFLYQSDNIGATQSHFFSGMYAYRMKFGKVNLSMGIQGGYQLALCKINDLKYNHDGDAVLESVNENVNHFYTGAGLYLHTENYFFSFSKPWLYNTCSAAMKNPWLASGGFMIPLSKDHQLKPSFLVRYVSNSPLQTDLSLNYYFKSRFGFAVSLRSEESFVFIAEYLLNEQLKAAISYDAGCGSLAQYHNGSTEFMLRYYFAYTKSTRNPRAFVY